MRKRQHIDTADTHSIPCDCLHVESVPASLGWHARCTEGPMDEARATRQGQSAPPTRCVLPL